MKRHPLAHWVGACDTPEPQIINKSARPGRHPLARFTLFRHRSTDRIQPVTKAMRPGPAHPLANFRGGGQDLAAQPVNHSEINSQLLDIIKALDAQRQPAQVSLFDLEQDPVTLKSLPAVLENSPLLQRVLRLLRVSDDPDPDEDIRLVSMLKELFAASKSLDSDGWIVVNKGTPERIGGLAVDALDQ